MNKISKELRKIAKLLISNIEVDPTQHRLQQLNQWIKSHFRYQATINLNKLNCKHVINKLKQKKIYNSYYGVYINNNINDDIEFKKTFVIPYNDKIPYDVKINENNLYTGITLENKEIVFSFQLTLKSKDWYPLFRSCKELTYDDNGKFDKKSFDKLKESLEKCFEELEI